MVLFRQGVITKNGAHSAKIGYLALGVLTVFVA